MACAHITDPELHPPRANQNVYREDCTQCFDSIDDEAGLNVCLRCFNGGCAGERNHGALHYRRSGHPLALNIKRRRKHARRDEPPPKISKLAIAAESEEDRYDVKTDVVCYACGLADIDKTVEPLRGVIEGIMTALTYSRQEEVKAWEQEYTPCEHTLCLQQLSPGQDGRKDLSSCSACDLRENLWLCLVCGNVGCGRSQFGGVGGHSHGLAHSTESGHAVAVKLGSITPEGNADVFCYHCNEERIDTDLAAHLAHWGINITEQQKTEKSLVELQIEQNLKWDFSMSSDGEEAEWLFGPGFTGMKNLGNSCYLASTLQCLFSIPAFQDRYFRPSIEPPLVVQPADDLETQMRKLADGLLSGRYSKRPAASTTQSHYERDVEREGLAPAMLKHLVGRGHEEFSSMRQQDAFEFMLHLFKLINISKHPDGLRDPTEPFRFALEQKLQCKQCKRVRYKVDELDNISVPVPARLSGSSHDDVPRYERTTLRECLDLFTAEETVDMKCPACSSDLGFTKQTLFKTFPEVLAVNARRFTLLNWVPTKLDIAVDVDDDSLDMGRYLSPGLQDYEEQLPDDDVTNSPESFDQESLSQLLEMGFPETRCKKALVNTGNSGAEPAMNWLFAHMDDPDIDDPIETSTKKNIATVVDSAQVSQLGEMGIEPPVARKALLETSGDLTRAIDWVFSHPGDPGISEDDAAGIEAGAAAAAAPKDPPGSSNIPAKFQLESIICHKGASVHSGHYVSFIRKQLPDSTGHAWVLYNDEKVVRASDAEEMKRSAYVYFFQRS